MSGGNTAGKSFQSEQSVELTLAQTRILNQRQDQFNETVFPGLKARLSEFDNGVDNAATSRITEQITPRINKAFSSAEESLRNRLGAFGINPKSPLAFGQQISLAGGAAEARSRAGIEAQNQVRQEQNQLFQIGQGFAPSTTGAASAGSNSKQSGETSFLGFINL